jgi:hypothetical protein
MLVIIKSNFWAYTCLNELTGPVSTAKFRCVFWHFLECRQLLKDSFADPMQFSTQFHHFTHDNYGWRLKFFSFGEIGNSFNGSYNPLLRRSSTGLYQRHARGAAAVCERYTGVDRNGAWTLVSVFIVPPSP